jgi:hypothetical protein
VITTIQEYFLILGKILNAALSKAFSAANSGLKSFESRNGTAANESR